ncbi:MAG TPA: 5-formyltetrahydrofolate cyclo-ligase [Xanthobacteraceae bacterium]|nr:5-formyltetrahydrofolate cyclo-ligase [Xanthobacteraceae bacterium]
MVTAAPPEVATDLIRRDLLARRDALEAVFRAQAAEAVANRDFPLPVPPGARVSGFMPIRSEINPLPLMRRLADAGAALALPTIAERGQPLVLRAWRLGDVLRRGQWGIREPDPTAPAVEPDVVLAPLAAFDRTGYRIGYGAGYYDLTLNALRARRPVVALGLAYAVQEVDAVPREAHDARLDFILTERETIDCRGA